MSTFHHPVAILLLIFTTALLGQSSAETALVHQGVAQASIILPADAKPLEQLAATELHEHIRLISGADLPIHVGPEKATGIPIYLGSSADGTLDTLTIDAGRNPSAFTVRVQDDRIDIRGLSDEGTLNGVYDLLEQLGVRWYMPGDWGRVLPSTTTVALAEQTNTQTPSMVWRRLQHLEDDLPWARRARLGGELRSTGQHGIPGDLPKGTGRQQCISKPESLAAAINAIRETLGDTPGPHYYGMSSYDGGGYCECETCLALDQGVYDPTADRESMTDRYVWFFNQVLTTLEDEYPDLHIVTYTYGAHMMPPAIEMHPRIVPVFAPITVDRTRGMDNPMSPDRHLVRWLLTEYKARGVKEMYFRGYYHNLACPQFPYSQIDQIKHETPALHDLGVRVMRMENIATSWSSAFLDLYLATRMMWNVDTDADALLDEFYTLYYGPAAAEMKTYHEGLDAAFRDTPYFTGGSYLYIPIFLGQPRREILRDALSRAAQRAEGQDPAYGKRIAAVRLNWDRMDIWLDMIDARNRHDFKTAHEKRDAYFAISDAGQEDVLEGDIRNYRSPRLVFQRERSENSSSYFNRFWRRPVDSGYERTVTIGELAAPLQDEWQFLLDVQESGDILGYQRPGQLGGNWQPMLTSSRSWSDQGLHYYKGVAWYRQKVTIPKSFDGRPVYLWFGGVDELAHVWVNDVDLGTNREPAEGLPGVPGTFRPFDLSATKAIAYGETNWVVVKITNKGLSEIGTGGIVAPVMFWSPKDPEWAPFDTNKKK